VAAFTYGGHFFVHTFGATTNRPVERRDRQRYYVLQRRRSLLISS